jgi:hypothetical protein
VGCCAADWPAAWRFKDSPEGFLGDHGLERFVVLMRLLRQAEPVSGRAVRRGV